MDQAYMGMEEISGSNIKLRRLVETSEDNYIDDEVSQTVQCETTGLGLPGNKQEQVNILDLDTTLICDDELFCRNKTKSKTNTR